jgi:hypothetical protein
MGPKLTSSGERSMSANPSTADLCRAGPRRPPAGWRRMTASGSVMCTGPAPGFSVFRVDTDQLSAAHWAQRAQAQRAPFLGDEPWVTLEWAG